MRKIIAALLTIACVICNAEPIEFIVSASPGGPNDTVTRKIVEHLEKQTNLQFVVFNKPGAAHTIAYNHVMSSNKPVLILSTPEIESHEVISNITELYNAGYFVNTLFVSEKSKIKTPKDLIELSKKREIIFGHGGFGSYSYMAMSKICKTTLNCLDVPYKSSAEGMMALLSGTIDAYAIVSYGSKQFSENDRYVAVQNITLDKQKSWFKLFGKNLSDKNKETIVNVLKSVDPKFYANMGFENENAIK